MRAVILLIGVIVVAGCAGPAASAAPSTGPGSTPAPLAVGEFKSKGVATKLDARGSGANVTGTMTMSDSGLDAQVDLECSRTTESGLLMIGGLVTESTFTEYFPKGHRIAIILERGSPVKSVWWVVMPGDEEPVATCSALVDGISEPVDSLEAIEGTVQLAP